MGGSVLGTQRASKLIREIASAACRFDPKVLIMLSAYCNGSGMRDGPHCFLGGYAADVDRWANCCDKWQLLCERHLGGKPLRITGNALPAAVLVEFAECIVDHADTEIWTAAPEYYLNKIVAKHGVKYDRYRLCFHGVLDSTANDYHLRNKGDYLQWWFAYPEGASGDDPSIDPLVALQRAFADARSLLTDDRKRLVHSLTFTEEESILPLQAARFLVDLQREYLSSPQGTSEHPAHVILREAEMNRIHLVWFDHTLEDSMKLLTAAEKH